MWDPREDGCRCDECPLRSKRLGDPVPWQENREAYILAVGESPGKTEVERGIPLVGRSGALLMDTLRESFVYRKQLALTNVVACMPPEKPKGVQTTKSAMEVFLAQGAREAKQAGQPWVTPMECCWPRVEREIAQYTNVFLLGAFAIDQVLKPAKSAMTLVGSQQEVDGTKFIANMHPAAVLRMRFMEPQFKAVIAKGVRFFQGRLNWAPFETVIGPTPDQLAAFLVNELAPLGRGSVDLETSGLDETKVDIWCVGFSHGSKAVVVPLIRKDGSHYYSYGIERDILDILIEVFSGGLDADSPDGRFLWVGQNWRYYDTMVLRHRLLVQAGRSQ